MLGHGGLEVLDFDPGSEFVQGLAVVALILIEGFGYREAAEMLGLPIGTVSSRLVRGRNALLAMLGGPADG